jgi:hypothetical protein
MCGDERDWGEPDSLLTLRVEVEDAAVGGCFDDVDEMNAAGGEDASEELQQLWRVMVAGEYDDRG